MFRTDPHFLKYIRASLCFRFLIGLLKTLYSFQFNSKLPPITRTLQVAPAFGSKISSFVIKEQIHGLAVLLCFFLILSFRSAILQQYKVEDILPLYVIRGTFTKHPGRTQSPKAAKLFAWPLVELTVSILRIFFYTDRYCIVKKKKTACCFDMLLYALLIFTLLIIYSAYRKKPCKCIVVIIAKTLKNDIKS